MLPELLKATRLIVETLGDRAFLLAEADQGPFSLATQIVGIEGLLMALTDPDKEGLVRRLLEYATEQVVTYARALIAGGRPHDGHGRLHRRSRRLLAGHVSAASPGRTSAGSWRPWPPRAR